MLTMTSRWLYCSSDAIVSIEDGVPVLRKRNGNLRESNLNRILDMLNMDVLHTEKDVIYLKERGHGKAN